MLIDIFGTSMIPLFQHHQRKQAFLGECFVFDSTLFLENKKGELPSLKRAEQIRLFRFYSPRQIESAIIDYYRFRWSQSVFVPTLYERFHANGIGRFPPTNNRVGRKKEDINELSQ